MNKKAMVGLMILCMLSCSTIHQSKMTKEIKAADTAAASAFEANFDNHDADKMHYADGWSNGAMFNCTWRKDNVSFRNGIMALSIKNDIAGSSTPWSGAEYRTNDFFHYGMYEVSMKAIKNDGVVTSFFTYTGPAENNPWDEIDVEILGKDTTKVQFNYFTNGSTGNEYVHNLGFDASKSFHTYGFLWLPNSITWYIDGQPVYTATSNIPSTPSRIMMNVWPGIGVDSWLNPFNGVVPLTAEYDWIKYTKQEGEPSEPSNSISNISSWATDLNWGQYLLENTGYSTMVYRYGDYQKDAYAHLIGTLEKPISSPKTFKIKVNFIDGNKLALTVKIRDVNGKEIEIGNLLYETWQKGIHEIEVPIYGVNTNIQDIILMINSNPYQIDLNKDSFCKVELLSTSLSN